MFKLSTLHDFFRYFEEVLKCKNVFFESADNGFLVIRCTGFRKIKEQKLRIIKLNIPVYCHTLVVKRYLPLIKVEAQRITL